MELHHFNTPPKASSNKGDNEVLHHKEGISWGLNNDFRISRMKRCRLNVK
jgi:hypothetical protein